MANGTRTKAEILRDIHQVETTLNRVTMEVGQSYARAHQAQNQVLIAECNQKIDLMKATEAQLRLFEQELVRAGNEKK